MNGIEKLQVHQPAICHCRKKKWPSIVTRKGEKKREKKRGIWVSIEEGK
jgi:hypothetical protein